MPPLVFRPAGSGLLASAARTAVVAGTAQVVAGRIAARQRTRAAQQEQAAAAVPAVAAPAPEDPTTATLLKLADLHQAGVLSDEEFAAAKARALGLT